MIKRKRILFISHEASHTGAPILLLTFLKWIYNKHPDYEIHIILGKGGPLLSDFKQYSKAIYFPDATYKSKLKPLNFLREYVNTKKIYSRLNNIKWEFIFSNTIVNGKILDKLDTTRTRVFSYIHELTNSIEEFDKKGMIKGTLSKSQFFFCGSKIVQDTITNVYQIPAEKTKVVYSFNDMLIQNRSEKINNLLRTELKIGKDDIVVGMVGSFVWRKGYDLFTKTALELENPNIHFVWVGADHKPNISLSKFDILKSKFPIANMHYINSGSDYMKYYNLFDLFFLSSREDPYPLVMTYAANYGLPIIAFENSGGAIEFIDSEVGHIIPFGNTAECARIIKTFKLQKFDPIDIQKKSTLKHNVEINSSEMWQILIRQIQDT